MEGPSDGSVTQPEFRRAAWYLEPNPSLGMIYSVSFTGLQNFPKSSECWAPLAVCGGRKALWVLLGAEQRPHCLASVHTEGCLLVHLSRLAKIDGFQTFAAVFREHSILVKAEF